MGDDGRFDTIRGMAELLDLEELDRDLYRGRNVASDPPRVTLFGGQVAAQALRAAAATVPDDRFPHSLHGYFLRPGRPEHPVILRVSRDRDGRSFSARHVAAIQDGEVIFSMLASFHVDEQGGELAEPMPAEVPAPEGIVGLDFDGITEIRPVGLDEPDGVPCRLWVRIVTPLTHDRTVQACALAYLSDIGSGFGRITRDDLPRGGPSIDHTVWFHRPARADRWLLLDLFPVKAFGGRGVYRGTIYDRDGVLAAELAQESLLRTGPSTPRRPWNPSPERS